MSCWEKLTLFPHRGERLATHDFDTVLTRASAIRERIRKALLEKGLWGMCLRRIDVFSISEDMGRAFQARRLSLSKGQWEVMKSVCLGNGKYFLAFRRCEQWCGLWSIQCMLLVLPFFARCYRQGGMRSDSGLMLIVQWTQGTSKGWNSDQAL